MRRLNEIENILLKKKLKYKKVSAFEFKLEKMSEILKKYKIKFFK